MSSAGITELAKPVPLHVAATQLAKKKKKKKLCHLGK
jgi:hypothetical protein